MGNTTGSRLRKVGAAVVGAYASSQAAKSSSRAVERGTAASAQAAYASTQAQIAEIGRQFDYQQRVLKPLVEQQYRAQGTYSDLLGIPSPGGGGGQPATTAQGGARTRDVQDQRRQQEIGVLQDILSDPTASRTAKETAQAEIDSVNARPYDDERSAQESAARGPQSAGPGSYGLENRFRGEQGQFVDPNLDPTRLQDVNTLGDTVRGNLLAGTSAGDDPYRQYVGDNQIAAASADEDARFARARDVTLTGARGGTTLAGERGDVSLADERAGFSLAEQRGGENLADGAAGTGVYGETFEESPGYAFQREELERQLEL